MKTVGKKKTEGRFFDPHWGTAGAVPLSFVLYLRCLAVPQPLKPLLPLSFLFVPCAPGRTAPLPAPGGACMPSARVPCPPAQGKVQRQLVPIPDAFALVYTAGQQKAAVPFGTADTVTRHSGENAPCSRNCRTKGGRRLPPGPCRAILLTRDPGPKSHVRILPSHARSRTMAGFHHTVSRFGWSSRIQHRSCGALPGSAGIPHSSFTAA